MLLMATCLLCQKNCVALGQYSTVVMISFTCICVNFGNHTVYKQFLLYSVIWHVSIQVLLITVLHSNVV